MTSVDDTIKSTLDDQGLAYEHPAPGRFFIALPGTKKLRTNCWLSAGEHALTLEAFVCRNPDESHEQVYRFLLHRNAKLYGVHYTIDAEGDIYLVGKLPPSSTTAEELDKLLGQVLDAADNDFNTIVELGFATSIRREYAWRTSRGESLANLKPFEHILPTENPE
jgi:putative sensory transduction regulator